MTTLASHNRLLKKKVLVKSMHSQIGFHVGIKILHFFKLKKPNNYIDLHMCATVVGCVDLFETSNEMQRCSYI